MCLSDSRILRHMLTFSCNKNYKLEFQLYSRNVGLKNGNFSKYRKTIQKVMGNFWQRCQDNLVGENTLQQMVLNNRISTCKRISLKPFLIQHAKINSKWIINQMIYILLQENIGVHLCYLGLSKAFSDMGPKARATTNKTKQKDKYDFIKI